MAVQAAALLHDIERLVSEPDRRIEHLAPDYQTFKNRHAQKGALIAADLLTRARADHWTIARVAALVREHERRDNDPDITLLNDADALSFFSINSAGFVRYFSPVHVERKVDYTLQRMSDEARAKLAQVRLPHAIFALIETYARRQRRPAKVS